MKNRKNLCMLPLLLLVLTGLFGCGSKAENIVAAESPLVKVENQFSNCAEIYTSAYQDKIQKQIDELEKKEYALTSPLVIANPYSTNTTGVYVYFNTEEKAQINYTVSTEGYHDFTRTLYNGEKENYATKHEYMLIGSIPGKENTICLSAVNEKGKSLGSYTFTYQAPDLMNADSSIQATVTKGESKEPLTNGLYTVLGNDISEDSEEPAYVAMYDNDGVVRCEIPIINFRAHEIIFDENGMYFSISSHQMVCMEPTGAIRRVYNMGDFTLHHDYVFGSKEDIVILASSVGADTKDDRIISMNIETGEITEVVDLAKLFPDYFATMAKPEGASVIDWMHLNSLAFVGEDSLIVSARETSTIIRIDHIYDNPTVGYMIGSDNFWAGSGYEDLLYEKDGSFSLQGGQHSVIYQEDSSLKQGQYYLIMFDNNNTYSLQRKDYDWSADDNYYHTGIAAESNGFPSYYYQYLVDENARTFQLVDSVPVDYSGFVSSVQQNGDNLIIDSGGAQTYYEYDKDHVLIQKVDLNSEKWIYRVKKYNFDQYWFAK